MKPNRLKNHDNCRLFISIECQWQVRLRARKWSVITFCDLFCWAKFSNPVCQSCSWTSPDWIGIPNKCQKPDYTQENVQFIKDHHRILNNKNANDHCLALKDKDTKECSWEDFIGSNVVHWCGHVDLKAKLWHLSD